MVRFYIGAISPYTLPRCRYLPSCSQFALSAFLRHGFIKGGVLAIRRLMRCHPWGGTGFDPVP